ncbi:hypothetical protein NE865_14862 [Phthorimaea operculella]|nr:hypothetical protein NE865_14862 [Phthorimaea operculella]
MARVARMALDVAIYTLELIHPAVVKLWTAAKRNSPKPTSSPVVAKLENAVSWSSNLFYERLKYLRDQMLPIEEQYLLRQLEIVRKKMKETKNGGGKDHPPFFRV